MTVTVDILITAFIITCILNVDSAKSQAFQSQFVENLVSFMQCLTQPYLTFTGW